MLPQSVFVTVLVNVSPETADERFVLHCFNKTLLDGYLDRSLTILRLLIRIQKRKRLRTPLVDE